MSTHAATLGPVPEPRRVLLIEDPAGLLRFDTSMGRVLGMLEPAAGWAALVTAIERGAFDTFLNEGSPVFPDRGHADWPSPTLLYVACLFAPESVVRSLLDRGADPRVTSGVPAMALRLPLAPLAAACERGSLALVQDLLRAGADANVGGAISRAVRSGNREIFEALVDAGAQVDVKVGLYETLLQVAQKSSRAVTAGIADRIRDLLLASDRDSTSLLRFRKTRAKRTPFSGFGRERLAADLTWLLLAVEGPADGIAEAVAPLGARVVRDAASRAVVGRTGRYVLKLANCSWSWHLLSHAVPWAQAAGIDLSALALRVSGDLSRRVLSWQGLVVSEFVGGVFVGTTDLSAEALAVAHGAREVSSSLERQALKRADEFCRSRALWLPPLQEACNGLELHLELLGCKESDVERVDALVTS